MAKFVRLTSTSSGRGVGRLRRGWRARPARCCSSPRRRLPRRRSTWAIITETLVAAVGGRHQVGDPRVPGVVQLLHADDERAVGVDRAADVATGQIDLDLVAREVDLQRVVLRQQLVERLRDAA